MKFSIFTTLYIMKYDPNPINSVYKIGITRNIEERKKGIQRTLTNQSLTIYWQGKFIFAYPIEQITHAFLSPFNYPMPVTVSGYTEFFDLNWLSAWLLSKVFEFIMFARFIVAIVAIWVLINWDFFTYKFNLLTQ